MKFTNVSLKTLVVCLIAVTSVAVADTPPNPVLWERSFAMNTTTTTAKNVGTIIPSTSYMVTSQDFQGIHVDAKSRNTPERIVFNFGDCCKSSNTTVGMLQSLNQNGISVPSIQGAPKAALIKRGNCNWSEKIAVANSFGDFINVSAVFIYDNETHGNDITLLRTSVAGSGSIGPPSYPTPLPADRSILNMADNDLNMLAPSSTVVYFVPFTFGNTFVERINSSYNPNNATARQYWLLVPYLDEVNWGYAGGDSIFSTGRGYLSYIIALAAIFLIGIIFLRWWRIRRMRAEYGSGGFNAFSMANGFNMQPRVNQTDPLPVDIVNSLPIDKYSEDLVKNVNCAICLEDFVSGKNDIRILPCGHGFCVLCIDPWLTQKSTMCPICKWDCLPVDLRRERNERLQQQQQQQHHHQQQHQQGNNLNNESYAINMDTAGPSVVTPTFTVPETNNNVQNINSNRVIPPTLLPSSSPPPSPRASDAKIVDQQDEKLSSLKNPFEESSISHQSSESSRPATTTPPPIVTSDDVDASSEKKSSTKD